MSCKSITKNEIRRLRQGWGIKAFVLSVLFYYFFSLPASTSKLDLEVLGANAPFLHLQATFAIFVPIVCLLFSFRSILKERENGQIKVTAGLPHSRREIVLGKFIAIGAVLSASLLFVILIITLFTSLFFGIVNVLYLMTFFIMTIIFVYACVSIGFLISTLLSTTLRATAALLVSVAFILGWRSFFTSQYAGFMGYPIFLDSPLPADDVLLIVRRIDPQSAFFVVTNWIYGTGNTAGHFASSLAKLHAGPNQTVFSAVYPTELTYPDSIPLYLTEPVSLVVLLLWIVFPLSIAVWRFEKGDII